MTMNSRFIVITGGNGAVAVQLAEVFAQEGAKILLWGREQRDRIATLQREYPIDSIFSDLANAQSSQAAWASYRMTCPEPPDALIHTAAIRAYDHRNLRDSDPFVWSQVANVNLVATANVLRILLPELALAKPGRVVLFGSDVARSGLRQGSAYSAAKAGISALCRSVAQEEPNVLLNVVSPGPIETDYANPSPGYIDFRHRYFDAQREHVPLGRLAVPKDFTGIVRFLISPDNTFLTGEEIFVNGGAR